MFCVLNLNFVDSSAFLANDLILKNISFYFILSQERKNSLLLSSMVLIRSFLLNISSFKFIPLSISVSSTDTRRSLTSINLSIFDI